MLPCLTCETLCALTDDQTGPVFQRSNLRLDRSSAGRLSCSGAGLLGEHSSGALAFLITYGASCSHDHPFLFSVVPQIGPSQVTCRPSPKGLRPDIDFLKITECRPVWQVAGSGGLTMLMWISVGVLAITLVGAAVAEFLPQVRRPALPAGIVLYVRPRAGHRTPRKGAGGRSCLPHSSANADIETQVAMGISRIPAAFHAPGPPSMPLLRPSTRSYRTTARSPTCCRPSGAIAIRCRTSGCWTSCAAGTPLKRLGGNGA